MKVMKNLNHTFRRFVQKQMIHLFRYASTEQEKSVYERDCIAVCKKFINQPDSIMLLTPISGKRYIRSEKNEIFIILDSHRVKIINHVYAYDVHINDKSWNQIISLFLYKQSNYHEKGTINLCVILFFIHNVANWVN